MNENDFKLTKGFAGYVSKPEVTDLLPNFLVKGSKNVLIDYASRVISRNGYSLYRQANTGGGPIRSAYVWDSSNGREFPIRVYDGKVEFDWNSTFNVLKTGLATSYLEFAKIWDTVEKLDMLLWVLGDANVYKWSGGVTKLWKSTSTTLTKQGVLTSKTTIAFVAGVAGSVAPTITDSDSNFLNAGFAAGDTLYVTGSTANSRNFIIGSVTASTITLVITDSVTTETAGPSITLHNGEPTWASSRFLSAGINKTIGAPTITIATPAVVTMTAHGLAIGDTVRFSTTGALPTGITSGLDYYVISDGFSADNFEISATASGAAINTSGGQSGVHTLKKTTRSIAYLGTNYPYSGGENTDTLTGLSSFPSVTVGNYVWQVPITLPNPSSITTGFKADLIGVQLNQLILASSKNQDVYGSSTTDYTNFTLTTPRAPADPFKVTMDNYATCIVPIDNDSHTTSSLMFGGGKNEFFQLLFQISQDNTSEMVRMIKLKTAVGSGLISVNAICPIKNSTVYISQEPVLDTLSNLQTIDGKNNTPISDLIKNDFDNYDFTNCDVIYWKRGIYVALPIHGLVLIYDLQRKLWQPPQTIAISRFSIIDDWLYGHSSITNETYKLFDGTDDNGVFIPQIARFAYNNGGRRDRIKNMSEYWSDGYISANGTLEMTLYFGFEGSAGKKIMSISGGDRDVTIGEDGSTLGDEPLGVNPLGGATLNPLSGLTVSGPDLLRFYQDDTADTVDYTESFIEYVMNTLGGQFAIVAHGNNQWDAGTAQISHKK